MAVSDDVNELVRILSDEGYTVLAGELLAEFGENDGEDSEGNEEPLTGDPHRSELERAVDFLRLRLVEPARKLAEAEEIAGRLLRLSNRVRQ